MEMRQKLWAIRQVTDWKQEQLATELGVSQSTVNRWLASVKPSQPKGPHWDAINRLYAEKVGALKSEDATFHSRVEQKLARLPEKNRVKAIDLLEAVLDRIAEWPD
jgi:transcriptional regulator with XRE-family HTH domain